MNPPETVKTSEEWNNRNYAAIYAWRQMQLGALRQSADLRAGALAYYATHHVDFINHWCDTVDPRNAGQPGMLVRMPFQLFQRQEDLITFAEWLKKEQKNGLVEKVRTAGATWTYCAYSVHQWRFVPGTAIGWGSRKEQLVDKIGDMDSIFEKIRSIIRGLPSFFWPKGFNPDSDKHMSYMRIVNPENGATITGEAGDNIGRGGRKTIYFKDESAHYERPDKIEASLSENTRVQIDVSSVNGVGNPFHRKRENGIEWTPETAINDPEKTPVFIFDVFDHPGNTREWYNARKKKFRADGLPHIFAQEIDRNYSASVEGIIIPQEYVDAIVDAHLYLRIKDGIVFYDASASIGDRYIDDSGAWGGALDVADGGGDLDAFTARKGVILRVADQWSAPDQGVSTRKTLGLCDNLLGEMAIQYDSIGVGAGVKTEVNRLILDNLMPKRFKFVAWSAAAKVYRPFENIIPNDKTSMLNVDYYQNFKAQAWWNLRMRAFKVYQMVMGLQGLLENGDDTYLPIEKTPIYLPEELISLDSKIPVIKSIKKELSQAVAVKSTALKLMVDKTPDGTRSPNLADSIVMNYFPARGNTAKAIQGTTSQTR